LDPNHLSEVVKNLEPEFRVRGRAIEWNRMNGLLYDDAMLDLVNSYTPERVDAIIERYDESFWRSDNVGTGPPTNVHNLSLDKSG
jgi:hypothetical protein